MSPSALFFELRRLHRWTPTGLDSQRAAPLASLEPKSVASSPALSERRRLSISSVSTASGGEDEDEQEDVPRTPRRASDSALSAADSLSRLSFRSQDEDDSYTGDSVSIASDAGDIADDAASSFLLEDARLGGGEDEGGKGEEGEDQQTPSSLAPEVPQSGEQNTEWTEEMRSRLEAERQERSRTMMHLLYDGLTLISKASSGIIGRFMHLVHIRNAGSDHSSSPLRACPRSPRDLPRAGVCQNDLILRAKDEIPLRLAVSVFAGLYMNRDTHAGESDELLPFGSTAPDLLTARFMGFFEEFKSLRAPRPRSLVARIRWRKRRPWILQPVLGPLFFSDPTSPHGGLDGEALSGTDLLRVRDIGKSK